MTKLKRTRAVGAFLARPFVGSAQQLSQQVQESVSRQRDFAAELRQLLKSNNDKETFGYARNRTMSEHEMSDVEFRQSCETLMRIMRRRSRILYLLGAAGVIYAIALIFVFDRSLAGATALWWAAVVVIMAMHSAMRYWQVANEELFSFTEWIKRGKLWC